MELDLALDAAAAPWSPDDPAQLSDETAWHQELVDWIQSIRADPLLNCPDAVRRADEVSLGLRFTDDATITELNANWRQKEQPTDVLSFAALEDSADWQHGTSVELGDIVVSL